MFVWSVENSSIFVFSCGCLLFVVVCCLLLYNQVYFFLKVLQVLGILRMNKYKEIFKEAQIDGEILADCDEEILEKVETVAMFVILV